MKINVIIMFFIMQWCFLSISYATGERQSSKYFAAIERDSSKVINPKFCEKYRCFRDGFIAQATQEQKIMLSNVAEKHQSELVKTRDGIGFLYVVYVNNKSKKCFQQFTPIVVKHLPFMVSRDSGLYLIQDMYSQDKNSADKSFLQQVANELPNVKTQLSEKLNSKDRWDNLTIGENIANVEGLLQYARIPYKK